MTDKEIAKMFRDVEKRILSKKPNPLDKSFPSYLEWKAKRKKKK